MRMKVLANLYAETKKKSQLKTFREHKWVSREQPQGIQVFTIYLSNLFFCLNPEQGETEFAH